MSAGFRLINDATFIDFAVRYLHEADGFDDSQRRLRDIQRVSSVVDFVEAILDAIARFLAWLSGLVGQ